MQAPFWADSAVRDCTLQSWIAKEDGGWWLTRIKMINAEATESSLASYLDDRYGSRLCENLSTDVAIQKTS